MSKDEWIRLLDLKPLEGEGGLWAPVYHDHHGNAIYFMMAAPDFSAWHRLAEPELWTHLRGGPIELYTIESGLIKKTILGESATLSYRVPAHTWIAARPAADWTLALCTLAPPFSGMQLADRSTLCAEVPGLKMLPDLFRR